MIIISLVLTLINFLICVLYTKHKKINKRFNISKLYNNLLMSMFIVFIISIIYFEIK